MKDMMHYKDYVGSVHFDENETIFHGKLEFIKALVSYEGTTAKGIKEAFEEAVDDYLSLCQKKGIEPEKPFKGSLNIRLGTDLHRRIAEAAVAHKQTINSFIVNSLEKMANAAHR